MHNGFLFIFFLPFLTVCPTTCTTQDRACKGSTGRSDRNISEAPHFAQESDCNLYLFCHRCDCKRAATGGTFARRFFCKQLPACTTICLLARQDPRKRIKCCWNLLDFLSFCTAPHLLNTKRLERMIPAPDAEFLSQRV